MPSDKCPLIQYLCDHTVCGIRYKTKPGLTYHMTHHHAKGDPDDLVESLPASPPRELEPPGKDGDISVQFADVLYVILAVCIVHIPVQVILRLYQCLCLTLLALKIHFGTYSCRGY